MARNTLCISKTYANDTFLLIVEYMCLSFFNPQAVLHSTSCLLQGLFAAINEISHKSVISNDL